MTTHDERGQSNTRVRFDPHGTRANHIDGRILISTIQGPYNLELLQSAGEAALRLRRSLMESGPWGYIEIVERSAMATPDAIVEMKRHNEDPARNHNRVAAALVLRSGVEGSLVAKIIYMNVWSGVAHPFRIFDEFEDARRWVGNEVDAAIGPTAQKESAKV